jgi:hypothetical protein
MKRAVLILLIFITVADAGFAQKRGKSRNKRNIHEISFGIGASNFLGELGGANTIGSGKVSIRDFDFPSVKPSINLGYRYQWHKHWAVKGDLNAAYIGGYDRLTEEMFRNNRNLNFRSPIVELGGRIEYCINYYRKGQQYDLGIRGWRNYYITTFFFVGAGGFWMDPRGKLNGQWIRLRPLCTEGQGLVPTRKKYSNVQFCIPFGAGLRYRFNKRWTMALEYGIRWTTTDYIDDVSLTYVDRDALRDAHGDIAVQLSNPCLNSNPGDPLYNSTLPGEQRGDPKDKDSYMFAILSLYYNLDRGFMPKMRF